MGGGFLLAGTTAQAQDLTCSGTVIDESGLPVIGAAIVEQGSSTNGVISDVDGTFRITVPSGASLEVSCIGYVTQTVTAAPNLTVVLTTDSEMLEGAISVGYGTMKKEDVTGAMVSVTSEDLVQLPVNNAVEALQGKAAGVVISTAGTRPGEVGQISVRGTNSISADQSPLVVIDGIVGQSVGLDMLNPQDIESIEILKDASATAIYGARGGNGVILVNTKKGKEGRFTLNYSGTATFEKIYDRVPMMNAADVVLGNTVPNWNLGFNNVLRWKNLELSIFIYGAFDFIAQTGQYQGGREPVISMNYYNENNKVGAEYQRPYFNTAGGDSFSGILLQKDASFLKVRQISLGYTLPEKWVKSIGLSNVKFTAQLKNPFSIYQGTSWMDSDYYMHSTKNSNTSYAGTSYLRGFVFGVNIGF